MYGATTGGKRRLLPGRGMSAAIALLAGCAIVTGCGVQQVSTDATSVPSARPASTGNGVDALGQPVLIASPHMASMPTTSAPSSASKPHPSASPSTAGGQGSSGSGSSGSGSSGSGSSGSGSPASAGPPPATCTNPQFTSSAQYGMWNLNPYYVYNDMWGISGYQVTQTINACSFSNWYVVADMNNDSGDGHVKTYPNSQRDFSSPQITSLSSVPSTFTVSGFPGGIYEYAYDIWINGLATSGSTEVMIWNYNHGQVPSGSVVASVTLDGIGFKVWKSGTYIAFVADSNFTSASMDLLPFFKWIIAQGWLTDSATLSQVCYGIELVSTNNTPETFSFSNFSVSAS